MVTQILAIIVVMTVVYLLLRLRHFRLACDKDRRKYYRAYVVGFDESDWDADPDDSSSNDPDSKGTAILRTAGESSLVKWPTELEPQSVPFAGLQATPDDDCDEAVRTATFTNYL